MEESKSMDIEKDFENIEEMLDPQLTSSDPNERKLARKLRIERRIDAVKRRITTGEAKISEIPDPEDVYEDNTLLEQQLQRSAKVIEMLLLDSEEHITNIRVANDSREVDRREATGVAREKVFDKLEEEVVQATEVFDRIAGRWSHILKYNDPLLIHEDLIHQKQKCDELIVQKDGVIAMLKDELAVSDKMFYDDQRNQNEDIHILAKRIEKQVQLVRKAYREELTFIENVVMVERHMLIDSNDKKWEELYKRRDTEEKANIERKFQQLEEFDEEITRLRIEHQEIFRETKIKLENDIEDLQREFEQIKAVVLINSEKMDYNYQILRKREDENIIIKSQQKRRINKLQDYTNDLRRKTREYEKSAASQILKLTDEVFVLQKCVLEQEVKSESMAKVNDMKYRQVWDLNTKRNTKLLDKILTIDELIYEQLLGLPWKKPTKQIWHKEDMHRYKFAIRQQSMNAIPSPGIKTNVAGNKVSSESINEQDKHQLKRLLVNILDQISSKSGFLVEYRLKYILDPYSYCEHVLVRIDNIFAALGIKKNEHLDSIIDFFLPYAYCPVCVKQQSTNMSSLKMMHFSSNISKKFEVIEPQSMQSSKSSVDTKDEDEDDSGSPCSMATANVLGDISQAVRQPDYVVTDIVHQLVYTKSQMAINANIVEDVINDEDAVSEDSDLEVEIMENVQSSKKSTVGFRLTCKHRHPLIINSIYVLRALREFINSYFIDKNLNIASAVQYISISRELHVVEVQEFWKRFKIIFAEGKENLWNGLLEGLKKYHAILQDRQKIYDELLKQRKENEELKALYLQYQRGKGIRAPCAGQRMQPYHNSPVYDPPKHSRSKTQPSRQSTEQDKSTSCPLSTATNDKKTPVGVEKKIAAEKRGKTSEETDGAKIKSGGGFVKKIK